MGRKVGDIGKQGYHIATVVSDSSPEQYEIRHWGEDYTCECMGYMSCKKRPRSCKHIKRYLLGKLGEVI